MTKKKFWGAAAVVAGGVLFLAMTTVRANADSLTSVSSTSYTQNCDINGCRSVSVNGQYLNNQMTMFGSSATGTEGQANSFINLATGDLGASSSGFASTQTEHDDLWLLQCNSICESTTSLAPFNVSLNFNITGTATDGPDNYIDYYYLATNGSGEYARLEFAISPDGGPSVSPTATLNFSNGTFVNLGDHVSTTNVGGVWTYGFNYQFNWAVKPCSFTDSTCIASAGVSCGGTSGVACPTDNYVFGDRQSVFVNTYDGYIDSSHSFHVNVDSNAPIYSLDGRTPTTAVPEPSTLLLLGSGLAGLADVIRRRINAR